jgi:DUF4097 and DUF4098 domain-containing protein YvlB
MNRFKLHYLLISVVIAALALGGQLLAAEPDNNRIVVPVSDPSRPAQVRAHLVSGSISVKAYDGKDVIVETRAHAGDGDEEKPERQGNLRRIPMASAGFTVESDNNQIRISASPMRAVDLVLTVPVHTSLSLHTVNGGDISVSGVDGELDVNDVNGSVTLKNVSGSVVAHALNGRVLATLTRVDPQKAMAFSSLNGDIDVTFPPDIKATLSMRTDNGEVYSDFDIQLQATAPQPTVEDGRGRGGKYVVKMERTVRGNINGGGQDIQFKNFNGNIYIRKGAK